MVFIWLFLLVLLSMFALTLVPSRLCNRYPTVILNLMRIQAAGAMLSVLGLTGWSAFQPLPIDISFVHWGEHALGFYLDGLSLTILSLVSFMTLIVGQFSVRYLANDPEQGRFAKWLTVTAASVLLFVISNHLLLFMAAWMMSSLGLHLLLTHYRRRSQAILAARKKFLVSRLGDIFLLGAFSLIYQGIGSWNYSTLFGSLDNGIPQSTSLSLASFLLVAGAMTKSAQFPLHSWLPESMETPTPVSAFMHAGIINAGGFLILRFSHLLVQSPLALSTLAMVGGFTALFGVLVMLTQTSIKKRLAYSTISQMGFMMLQCGLGAFTAATVHIVVHSLYKGHAFLSSGGILEQAKKARFAYQPHAGLSALALLGLTLINTFWCGLSAWIWQVPILTKSGGIILSLILILGCMTLNLQLHENAPAHPQQKIRWIPLAGLGVSFFYFATYRVFDSFLHPIFTPLSIPRTLEIILGICVVSSFMALFWLEKRLRAHVASPRLQRLYILIRNEFYADIYLKRVCRWAFVPASRHAADPLAREEFYV